MQRTKKRLKSFEVGDVIKYDESYITPEETIRRKVKTDYRGVIIGIGKSANDYSYYIQWFHQIEDTLCTHHYQLKLCEGMKKPDICDRCRYRFECRTTREEIINRTTPRLARTRI